MTDPTTLSAAALDALAKRGLSHDAYWNEMRIALTQAERDQLVAQARRTEAAERKIAKTVALIDNDPTTSKADIRRALQEG